MRKSNILLTAILSIFFLKSNAQWIPVVASDTTYYFSCFAQSGTNIFAGTAASYISTIGNGILLSTNSGANWAYADNGLESYNVYSLAISRSYIFTGTTEEVFVSNNNGTSWSSANNGITGTNPISAFAINGNNILAGSTTSGGGTTGGIFVSSNNGSSWTREVSGLPGNFTLYALVVKGGVIYAGTSDGIYASSNNGNSWYSYAFPASYVTNLAVSGNNIFAATGNGTGEIYFSDGGGFNPVLSVSAVYSLVANDSVVFAGTSSGVEVSSDNGANWCTVNTGLNGRTASALLIDNSVVFVGTFKSTNDEVIDSNYIYKRPLAEMTHAQPTIRTTGSTTFCQGQSVTLTSSLDIGNTWSNGDTTQSIVIDSSGNYFVNYTTQSGCTISSAITPVTVNPLPSTPIIYISIGNTTFCQGNFVKLGFSISNPTSTPYTYLWSNGVTAYSAINVYDAGSYSVVVTDSDGCSATSIATIVTVNPLITPSVSISSGSGTTICAGTSVTFTATPVNGGGTPSYQWYLNGATVGTNSFAYSNSSLKNNDKVYCVLTSDTSCVTTATANSDTISMTVIPTVTPAVIISVIPGDSLCAGTSVTFSAASINGGTTPSYQWKINGDNAGINSVTFNPSSVNNNDIITCVLTSNASCATSSTATSNAITITLNPSLTPSVTITSNIGNTICSGHGAIFTAKPINGGTTPSYQWRVNGNDIGTNSPNYSDNSMANGDIITCVLTSNALCVTPLTDTSNSITMTVNSQVIPSITISAVPGDTICNGDTITFNAAANGGGTAPSYQWKVNGNNNGTNSNSFSSSSLQNNDIVTCELSSNASCATPETVTSTGATITVYSLPDSAITVNGSTSICEGDSVELSAPFNLAYLWSTAATTQNIFAKIHGDYSVIVTSVNNCSATSAPVAITVNSLPTQPSISQSGDTLISTVAVEYQWYLDSILISGATNQKFGIIQDGNYQVEISDSNGCMNWSAVFPVTSTEVNNVHSNVMLNIYPNPNSGTFEIHFINFIGNAELQIFNSIGQKVFTQSFIDTRKTTSISLGDLPEGIYFLQVFTKDGEQTIKFVIGE